MTSAQHGWEIGLSSWIIQDGNYGDFETGQHAEFALEFYPQSYSKTDVRSKSSRSLGAAKYEIVGEVLYASPEAWVLDFGICAFRESEPPEGISVGDFVASEIHLGIDPFFYVARLHSLPSMPALIYSWRIELIRRFIQAAGLLGKVLVRDEKESGYEPVAKTDAWKDNEGMAEYVLTCLRLDVPPKFERAKAPQL